MSIGKARHRTVLLTYVSRYFYRQLMRLGNTATIEVRGYKGSCERVASSYRIGDGNLRRT